MSAAMAKKKLAVKKTAERNVKVKLVKASKKIRKPKGRVATCGNY